jgi:hypothetical protein
VHVDAAKNIAVSEVRWHPWQASASVRRVRAEPTIDGYRENSPIRTDLRRARPGGIHESTRCVRRDEPGEAQAQSSFRRLSQQPVAAN